MTDTQQIPNDQPCSHGRWLNRAVTVDAVVRNGSEILLVQRKEEPFAGFWALPGGYLDHDETTAEAAVREAWEETGVRGKLQRLIGVFDNPERHPEQAIAIAYELTAEDQPIVAQESEILEARWWPIDDLPSLAFDHEQIVTAVLALG